MGSFSDAYKPQSKTWTAVAITVRKLNSLLVVTFLKIIFLAVSNEFW